MMNQTVLLLFLSVGLIFGQHCTHRKTDGAIGRNFKPLYPALSKDIVNYVNKIANTTWTSKKSSKVFLSVNDIKRRLGVVDDPNRFRLPKLCKMLSPEQKAEIPESFDARETFGQCNSLKTVRDHGDCASSWAMAAVEAINDRNCVLGKEKPALSVADVLSCCGPLCGSGCGGGIPAAAWDFWVHHGIVSGQEGCKPYPFKTRMTSDDTESTCHDANTPKCSESCEGDLAYNEAKVFGERAYTLKNDEVQIRHEITKYGSVQAEFDVYADFLMYEDGVYQHTAGHKLGSHAVRIIGWGEEKGTKFWLCLNNWNTQWGKEGTFKIKRGTNECNIEMNVNSGIPK